VTIIPKLSQALKYEVNNIIEVLDKDQVDAGVFEELLVIMDEVSEMT
jgi:hypothetical protein